MFANFTFDYFFWVVAVGSMALGLVSGIVGTTFVLEKQSQLGDAIGHAVYPGVIVTFMIFQTRQTGVLLIGAIAFGLIAFWLIAFIRKHSQFPYESILALVLSSLFSLGLLLYNIVQTNSRFQTVNFAGLNTYIMGQAAFLMRSDVELILIVSGIILVIFWLIYPKIKITLFDKVFAETIGINTRRVSHLLLLMGLLIISVGLQAVGAKLISSMLVAPAIAAKQWTNAYPRMIFLSGFFGTLAAFLGTLLSTAITDVATGPMIVIMLTTIALFSLVFGPKGLLVGRFNKQSQEVVL